MQSQPVRQDSSICTRWFSSVIAVRKGSAYVASGLARALKIAPWQLGNIPRGRINPRAETLKVLAATIVVVTMAVVVERSPNFIIDEDTRGNGQDAG